MAVTVNYSENPIRNVKISIALDETHINHIIKGPVLRNGNEDRLMVSSCVDGRELVDADGKTVGNRSSKFTALSCIVQALEEHEFCGISDSGLV